MSESTQTLPLARFRSWRLPVFKWRYLWPEWLLSLIVPVLILALWHVAATRGWIAEQTLPAPAVVYQAFLDLWDSGEWWANLSASLWRVAQSFTVAAIGGVGLGVWLGVSRRAEAYFGPIFNVYAQTPVIAWVPIGLLLFGISERLPLFLIAIAAIVPVLMNSYKGVRNIPEAYFEIARVYGFNRWQRLIKVIFPAALPAIFVGLRYGLTQAWLTIVIGEMVGIELGVGSLIVQARNLFQIDIMLVLILTLGVVGLLIDKAFGLIESYLLRWRRQGF